MSYEAPPLQLGKRSKLLRDRYLDLVSTQIDNIKNADIQVVQIVKHGCNEFGGTRSFHPLRYAPNHATDLIVCVTIIL